jgi:hypothetical protein
MIASSLRRAAREGGGGAGASGSCGGVGGLRGSAAAASTLTRLEDQQRLARELGLDVGVVQKALEQEGGGE